MIAASVLAGELERLRLLAGVAAECIDRHAEVRRAAGDPGEVAPELEPLLNALDGINLCDSVSQEGERP